MNKITEKVARKQAQICLALVPEMDRYVAACRQPVDQALARIYRQHREYGARDRHFFTDAVFSWFRWRGWLKTPGNENIAAAILLDAPEIIPQLEYMLENSGLAKAGLKPLGPLNLEEKAAWLQQAFKIGPLNSAQLAPAWLPDYLYTPPQLDREHHLRQCLQAFQTRPPTWLRLRANQRDRLLNLLAQMGVENESHPLLKQAVFIKGPRKADFSQLAGAESQDLASQCIGICCAPLPGQKWWDMCSGAGGKSLHLADLMQDNGLVLATDIRPAILEQLSRRLKRNKYRLIKISLWNGAADPAPETCFDGVLVDAPCSGVGTWHRNPDARWRTFPEQIRNYVSTQENLLRIAAKKVKLNGRLVYATCTLTKAENTDLIARFLEEHDDFRLEPTINPLNRNQTEGLIWIWPWEWNSNGMFIAVMKKNQ